MASIYSPFIRYAQMKFWRRLIAVPLSTFHLLAEVIGDPKADLIFLFNTSRCGSTLLTQVHSLKHSDVNKAKDKDKDQTFKAKDQDKD